MIHVAHPDAVGRIERQVIQAEEALAVTRFRNRLCLEAEDIIRDVANGPLAGRHTRFASAMFVPFVERADITPYGWNQLISSFARYHRDLHANDAHAWFGSGRATAVRFVLPARPTLSHWRSTLTAMMTSLGVRLVLVIAICATIGCDRVTKHVAATTLSEAPRRSFLADTFRLEYAENTGAFLGLGADWPRSVRTTVFGVGNGLLLVALAVAAWRGRWPGRALLGVALFVAGGASNLLDRITYGMVIDFMNVGIGSLRTGIFNVADMAIMLGAGILVLEGYRSDTDPPPKASG